MCAAASFACNTFFENGALPGQTENVTVQTGSGNQCAPGQTTTINPRPIPKHCLYANEGGAAETYGVGGRVGGAGRPLPVCDGRCMECESSFAQTSATGRPWQCNLMDPVPGSGVCEDSPASRELEEQQMRATAGVLPGGSGESCEWVQTHQVGGTGQYDQGFQACTVCDAQSCHKEGRPSFHHPYANETNPGQTVVAPNALAQRGNGTTANTVNDQQQPPNAPAAVPNKAPATGKTPPASKAPEADKPPTDGQKPAPNSTDNNQTTPGQTVANPGQAKAGDPVNVVSGSFDLEQTDLSFDGPHRPLTLTRVYDSQSNVRSELGVNWTHNWDVRIVPLTRGNTPPWLDPYCAGSPDVTTCIMLHAAGATRVFTRDTKSGLFMPQAGDMTTIAKTATGWVQRAADGSYRQFDADGYMTRDADRFGNGFSLAWELNPFGLLDKALCPTLITQPNGTGHYVFGLGPTGEYTSDHVPCDVLMGLTGRKRMLSVAPQLTPAFSETDLPTWPGMTTDMTKARELLLYLQGTHGRRTGSGSPYGQRSKRVLSVTDDHGRALSFVYYSTADRTPVGSSTLPHAGLLHQVFGPGDTIVTYGYGTTAQLPDHLNAAFLVSVQRSDAVGGGTSVMPTPERMTTFEYDWASLTARAADLAQVGVRYKAYLDTFSNCSYALANNCSSPPRPVMNGFQLARNDGQIQAYVDTLAEDLADNIRTVTNTTAGSSPIVESETRYETDLYSDNFDKVVKQRWGSSYATPSAPGGGWLTTYPEASFSYVEAGPANRGTDEVTNLSSVLDGVIRARYPLEVPLTEFQHLGGVLHNRSDSSPANPRPLAPIAIGDQWGTRAPNPQGSVQACKLGEVQWKQSFLPTYRPEFDYYGPSLTQADPETPTPGVSNELQLKRSVMSCSQLAEAQLWDAKHNDLEWEWQRVPNDNTYSAHRVTGRRKYINANANRICAWTRVVDRDGATHVFGLNYMGRQLVDAVFVATGASPGWRFAETLYNADGNVISKRRTLPESEAWSPSKGDTRFGYFDVTTTPTNDVATTLPAWWLRRGNVMTIIERPRGGTVSEVDEQTGAPVVTTGRFTTLEYEPFFNQVLRTTRGWRDSQGQRQVVSTTTATFDYQEPAIDSPAMSELAREVQSWGFQFGVDAARNVDPAYLAAHLPTLHDLGDVNSDGHLGHTMRGLPIQVTTTSPTGQREFRLFRWAKNGRPYFIQREDGSATAVEYYKPLWSMWGSVTGTVQAIENGPVALVRQLPRTTNDSGPNRAPCPLLPGPYQWLLDANCSSPLGPQLASALRLPAGFDKLITDTQAVPRTTRFEYSMLGETSRIIHSDGSQEAFVRDADGRVLEHSRLHSTGQVHSSVRYFYDTSMHVKEVRRLDGNGASLGKTFKVHDEEGSLIWECSETEPGSCPVGAPPVYASGSAPDARYWYSPEGHLWFARDAENTFTQYVRDARKWVTHTNVQGGSQVRQAAAVYDDDGNVVTTIRGTVAPAVEIETTSYDGYGRPAAVVDSAQVRHEASWAPNDTLRSVVSSENGASGGLQWSVRLVRDSFGRVVERYVNDQWVEGLSRLAGGAVWRRHRLGEEPEFFTYGADGRVAYSERESGEVLQIFASDPVGRVAGAATVRRKNGQVFTTASVAEHDLTGGVISRVESGAKDGVPSRDRATTYLRNASGFVLGTTDPLGTTTEFVRDFLGQLKVKRELHELGDQTTTYSYNRRGQLLTETDAAQQTIQSTYNGFGELATRTTPAQQPVLEVFTYDGLGRRLSSSRGGEELSYAYNGRGLLQSITSATHGLEREFTYDELGRLTAAQAHNPALGGPGAVVPSAERVVVNQRTYDALGAVETEATKVGTRPTRTAFNWWYRMPTSTWRFAQHPNGASTSELTDGLGRRALTYRPNWRTTSVDYLGELRRTVSSDKPGSPFRLKTAFDAFGQAVEWKYTAVDVDANGNPEGGGGTAVCPGGWDKSCGEPVMQITAARDAVGRLLSYEKRIGVPFEPLTESWRGYTYSARGHVRATMEAPGVQFGVPQYQAWNENDVEAYVGQYGTSGRTWKYDRDPSVGNLTSITERDSLEPPRFDNAARDPGHQLKQYEVGGVYQEREFDASGRVVREGDRSFSWDSFGQLTHVRAVGTNAVIEVLQYDAFGRLVTRRTQYGLDEEVAYDRGQMVAAWDDVGNQKWHVLWDQGVDHMLAAYVNGVEYLPMHDGKGNVGGYYNADSNRLETTAEYTPEGRVSQKDWVANTTCTDTGTTLCQPMRDIPFGLHSAYTSKRTALVYFRNRWYSRNAGEWLSQDPLGTVDSANLYAFNGFDPVNRRDPFGLASKGQADQGKECSECTFEDDEIVVDTPPKPGQPKPLETVVRAPRVSVSANHCVGPMCASGPTDRGKPPPETMSVVPASPQQPPGPPPPPPPPPAPRGQPPSPGPKSWTPGPQVPSRPPPPPGPSPSNVPSASPRPASPIPGPTQRMPGLAGTAAGWFGVGIAACEASESCRAAVEAATDRVRNPPQPPARDGTGKVHDPIPERVPPEWTNDQVTETIEEFEESIKKRERQRREEWGDDPGHTERIRRERDFLEKLRRRRDDGPSPRPGRRW